MEFWLWAVIGILFLIIVCLSIKIYLLRKSAREIEAGFADRLITDTNTLLNISSRDRYMKKLARSINVQLGQLRRERHQFAQGNTSLKEAVTNISHDLRTPLTAICGYLDLLEQEEKTEAAARYLEVIKNHTEILKQLTEELFCYSVFTSADNDTVYETVTINQVLEESISAYYAGLKSCGITPEIIIPANKVRRRLSKNDLSRIFGNIISNALKYSDGDLQITLSENGETVFSNSASKLGPVQAGKLFDRFFTVETAAKSTGLGLSIAKALTEQMHGSITAQYENGVLRIHVLFPETPE